MRQTTNPARPATAAVTSSKRRPGPGSAHEAIRAAAFSIDPLERRLLLSDFGGAASVSPAAGDPGAMLRAFNSPFWGQPGRQSPSTLRPSLSPQYQANIGDVNENWSGSPGAGVGADNFSTVVTGQVKTNAAGSYRFLGFTDDDGIVFVNNQLTSYDPNGHGERDPRAQGVNSFGGVDGGVFPITLAADTWYDFAVFQAEGTGGAAAVLRWIEPGLVTPTVVPVTNLSALPNQPAAPTGLSATPFARSVLLTWADASTSEMVYRVERNGVVVTTLPLNSTQYTDTGLTPGTPYTYRVYGQSFDRVGVAGTTEVTTTPVEPAPNAPIGLTARAVSPTAFRIRFEDNSGNENGWAVTSTDTTNGNRVMGTIPGRSGIGELVVHDFSNAGHVPGRTYRIDVSAFSSLGGSSAPVDAGMHTAGGPGGTGLRELIWDNLNPGSFEPDGAPSIDQIDALIGDADDQFGSGGPAPGIGADTFAVGWTGYVEPSASGNYTFQVRGDDGFALRILGQKLIDHRAPKPPTDAESPTVPLQAGTKYPISLEFYESGGGAIAQLYWRSEDAGIPSELVPQANLFPTPPGQPPPAAPSNLRAFNLDGQALSIGFDDNEWGEIRVDVQKAFGGGAFTSFTTLPAGSTHFTDTGPFTPGVPPSYQVRAVRAEGVVSPWSPTVTVTPAPNVVGSFSFPTFAPGGPFVLTGDATVTGGAITLTPGDYYKAGGVTALPTVSVALSFVATYVVKTNASTGADGFSFNLGTFAPTARGRPGGDQGAGGLDGRSINVRINNFNNTTGLTFDGFGGNLPNSLGAIDVDNGNPIRHTFSYNATAFVAASTITDEVTGQTVTHTYPLNLAQRLGSTVARVNVTGGTGALWSDQQLLTLTFASENRPPGANDDSVIVAEDSGGNALDVLGNDTDPDGDVLSVTSATQGNDGDVQVTTSGVVYTPHPNFFGTDTFTYTISDQRGGTDTATVTVNVTPVSDFTVYLDNPAFSEPYRSNLQDLGVGDPFNGFITFPGATVPVPAEVSRVVLRFDQPTTGGLGDLTIQSSSGTPYQPVSVTQRPNNTIVWALDKTVTADSILIDYLPNGTGVDAAADIHWGDFNLDGSVTFPDLAGVAENTFDPARPSNEWALGDFDYNGFVDDDDVTLLGALYDPSDQPLPGPLAVGPSGQLPRQGAAGGVAAALVSPIEVTSVNDAGAGSLRAAVEAANAQAGSDVIRFNIPGGGVRSIALQSALPPLTERVFIDGSTQPGFTDLGAPLIELNGAAAGPGTHGLVLAAGAARSIVQGLAVNRFGGDGISVAADRVIVIQCVVGTGPTPANPTTPDRPGLPTDLGNAGDGISVAADSTLVALSVVAHNLGSGVVVHSGTGSELTTNAVFANGGLGIDLDGDGVRNLSDPDDADTGPNGLMNHPELTSASSDGTTTTVAGQIVTAPNRTVLLRFYAGPTPDGQGRTLLRARAVSVVTGGDGVATFSTTFPTPLASGYVTALAASDPASPPGVFLDTSEFSPPVVVPGTVVPQVAAAFASGSTWAPAFGQFLASGGLGDAGLGLLLPAVAGAPLPWANLDRLSLRFDGPVAVEQQDLLVTGVNVADYAIGSFAYDPATFTATWVLSAAVRADRLALSVPAGAVTGGAGPGGPPMPAFALALNVLPGDVDRNGAVNIFDTLAVRNRQGTSTTSPGTAPNTYSVFHDVDGNAAVNIFDTLAARNRQGTGLPAGQPVVAAAPLSLFADRRVRRERSDELADWLA